MLVTVEVMPSAAPNETRFIARLFDGADLYSTTVPPLDDALPPLWIHVTVVAVYEITRNVPSKLVSVTPATRTRYGLTIVWVPMVAVTTLLARVIAESL